MNGRKAILGLCMLCALLVSAFAAQSASAEEVTGTTAFTCVKDEVAGPLRGAHCLASGEGKYKHVEVPQGVTTELTGTNGLTAGGTTESRIGKLRETLAGVPLELQATGVSGSGWMTNGVDPNGEHYTHGEGTITFSGVTVKEPAGRGCKVYTDNEASKTEGEAGTVKTRQLKASTTGQGHFLKFEPADGPENSFANFFITCEEGKKIPAIEGTWECKGTVKGVPNGATTEFTHASVTTENTLKCKGAKAGIDGALTLSGRAVGESTYTPLAATTVTTKVNT